MREIWKESSTDSLFVGLQGFLILGLWWLRNIAIPYPAASITVSVLIAVAFAASAVVVYFAVAVGRKLPFVPAVSHSVGHAIGLRTLASTKGVAILVVAAVATWYYNYATDGYLLNGGHQGSIGLYLRNLAFPATIGLCCVLIYQAGALLHRIAITPRLQRHITATSVWLSVRPLFIPHFLKRPLLALFGSEYWIRFAVTAIPVNAFMLFVDLSHLLLPS